MKVQIIANGQISLILTPENPVEEATLKQITKQQNVITELRTSIHVLNNTYSNGIVIGKSFSGTDEKDLILPLETNLKVNEKENM
jgi:hypothetical protein